MARRRGTRESRAEEGGLVVLEWLLVVAAVAGLTAVGVVAAQRTVDDVAEGGAAFGARATAAAVAAAEVEHDARAASAGNRRTATWADWERHFSARCARLEILYRDAGVELDGAFASPTSAGRADPISAATLASAGEQDPTGTVPQAKCNVGGGDVVQGSAAPPATLRSVYDAAKEIERDARVRRDGETWTEWKQRFENRCIGLHTIYGNLRFNVEAAFHGPTNHPSRTVTDTLLSVADDQAATDSKPQIMCRVSVA